MKVVEACGGLVNDVEAKVVGVCGGAVNDVGTKVVEARGVWVLKGVGVCSEVKVVEAGGGM
ncbi:hypothetical protein GCM10009827_047770 [Dactylosporangium maewongense]|uniref:Uncharacterized protein n=1 Tax=Dactylosporangium maewongense TaxID=634393 RepID=A0ABP4LJW9_9ACTN